jgi:predicted transcriptional regulator
VGRAFFYTPCVAEREARQSDIRHVLQRFFGNSRERLVLSLLGDSDATPEELERMKKAIANAPDEGDGPGDAPEET